MLTNTSQESFSMQGEILCIKVQYEHQNLFKAHNLTTFSYDAQVCMYIK